MSLPGPTNVRTAVAAAVREGRLPKHPERCEVCGAPGFEHRRTNGLMPTWSIVLHHHSLEQPYWLDVVPVCRVCHTAIHLAKIPEPRTGEFRSDIQARRAIRRRAEVAARRAQLVAP